MQPRWRGDGRELFYRHGNEVLSTSLTTAGAELRFSVPRVLFKGEYLAYWDVLPDGQRFVFVKDFAQPRTAVTLVQNWFTELNK